jgi:transposase-like protein
MHIAPTEQNQQVDSGSLRHQPAAGLVPLRRPAALRRYRQSPAAGLHRRYRSGGEGAARARFDEFAEAWGGKYPAISRLCQQAWLEFVPFLAFNTEVRTVVCSTNAIESVNVRIRHAVRARGHFPNETAR